MRILAKPIEKLIESFERLPGIGPKSAARLTYYLLHVPQEYLDTFAENIGNLKKNTVTCTRCMNVAETDPCPICADPQRDESLVMMVEQPLDVLAIERTGKFNGVYHVLHGAINPLNNIGPEEIRISELIKRAKTGKIKEIIMATNPNMEGEATSMFITRELRTQNLELKITRLAHGLPVGGDIEYADEVTLTRAMEGRREY
ncbi:MAG: Recombination protein RecR [Candidatus Gottesmanbacteria bacterium GW2011_GWC2_39_8]|uniref:Recombination protein RecR n=1 Tax=Candidatus Gottesmanbacteria bacterium GW2011_GWC2_39_8 TaxID=1618450 RepID=A0A0G0Q291_9BACT|nr:MAG: Recombination protein RecR [Candidatus Gottesmanbacteria bacterium GW2011_GWC2_39_8]